MNTKLPQSIQPEIEYHLKNKDFKSAKDTYDQWLMKKDENSLTKEKLVSSSIQDEYATLF